MPLLYRPRFPVKFPLRQPQEDAPGQTEHEPLDDIDDEPARTKRTKPRARRG